VQVRGDFRSSSQPPMLAAAAERLAGLTGRTSSERANERLGARAVQTTSCKRPSLMS